MKKLAVTFFVLVIILSITVPVLAYKKPNKHICWELTGPGPNNGWYLIIGTKLSGVKIRTGDGRVKFYHVQGVLTASGGPNSPITGSGFMGETTRDEPTFYATAVCKHSNQNIYHMELYWNIDDWATLQIDMGDNSSQESYELLERNCNSLSIVINNN